MAIGPFKEEIWGNIAVYTCCDVTGSFHLDSPLVSYFCLKLAQVQKLCKGP